MMSKTLKVLGLSILIVAVAATLSAADVSVDSAISDVQITNVRSLYFVVSWLSAADEAGWITYGTSPDNLSTSVPDARGAAYEGQTHYVEVSDLAPSTTYFFDIHSNGTVDDNGGAHWQVTTGPELSPPSSAAAWGLVYQSDGATFAEGAIVLVQIQDDNGAGSSGKSAPMSALVQNTGFWFLNLKDALTPDLSSYFNFSTTGDLVVLDAEGGPMGQAQLTVDVSNAGPAPDMQLEIATSPTHYIWLPLGLQANSR
jgi:hypothetical protein